MTGAIAAWLLHTIRVQVACYRGSSRPDGFKDPISTTSGGVADTELNVRPALSQPAHALQPGFVEGLPSPSNRHARRTRQYAAPARHTNTTINCQSPVSISCLPREPKPAARLS